MIANDQVIELIESLYRSRETIAEAYSNETTNYPKDKEKNINKLLGYKVLASAQEDGHIRLLSAFREFIDTAINKQKIIAANTDVGNLIDALEILTMEFISLQSKGRFDESTKVLREIRSHFYAIFDKLDAAASQLLYRVQSKFGQRKMGPARQKENKLYLAQAEQLQDSFERIQKEFKGEFYQENVEIARIEQNISLKLAGFHDRLTEVNDIISSNLFKLRKLKKKAKQIRVLHQFLAENPDFDFEKSLAHIDQCEPLLVPVIGIKVKAFPDLTSKLQEDELREIVHLVQRSLKIEAGEFHRETSGSIDTEGNISKEVLLKDSEVLFFKSVKILKGSDLTFSATDFLYEHRTSDMVLTKRFWLYYLMTIFSSNYKIGIVPIKRLVNCRIVAPCSAQFTDNLILEDIILSGPKAKEEQVEILEKEILNHA